jgi:anti-sigma factor RsiW
MRLYRRLRESLAVGPHVTQPEPPPPACQPPDNKRRTRRGAQPPSPRLMKGGRAAEATLISIVSRQQFDELMSDRPAARRLVAATRRSPRIVASI